MSRNPRGGRKKGRAGGPDPSTRRPGRSRGLTQRQLRGLIARNLRVYFSDPAGVLLSLLGAMIVIFIYILFLSDMQTDQILQDVPGLARADVQHLLNTWLMAGAAAIAAATTGLGAMVVFVSDRETRRFDDFLVSPLSRSVLTLGYMCAAIVVSGVMTSVVFGLGVAYCFATGASMGWADIGLAWGCLLLCCIGFTAVFGFVGSLLGTSGAFSATSVVVGTALGFFAGVYLPIGVFSTGVADVVSALPFSQGASLVRNFLMDGSLSAVADTSPQVADYFREYLGVTLSIGDTELSHAVIALVLAGLGVLFTGLTWLVISRRVR